jgi:hypothetical protein
MSRAAPDSQGCAVFLSMTVMEFGYGHNGLKERARACQSSLPRSRSASSAD